MIRREACAAIVKILPPMYICLSVRAKLVSVIDGFRFPQCGGAVDGTQTPIEASRDNTADYHNCKSWQGVVDYKALFTDICWLTR